MLNGVKSKLIWWEPIVENSWNDVEIVCPKREIKSISTDWFSLPTLISIVMDELNGFGKRYG